MKKIILPFAIAAVLLACGSAASDDGQQAVAARPAKAVDGEKIYKTYCVTCHGVYGDMGASGAFNLQTSQLSLKERIEVVTNGRNAMTPFKGLLNEEKIEAVAKYVEQLRKS
ncbi:MAG: hypothetical protein RLY31_859 [Bacteroidota bacterium]|jgi:mono/diheme cytochrome c family protein